MTDGIKTVKDGAILEITIDRPKANAIDLKASRRLNQQTDFPVPRVIAQSDRAAIFGSDSALSAQDQILRP